MSENREITLEIGDQEFLFRVSDADISKYINSMTNTSKIAPSHNLLLNTVDQAQRATLKPLLKNSLVVVEIASVLVDEYGPKLAITVKKSSSTLSA